MNKKENALKQLVAISEVIDKIRTASHGLFEDCRNHTTGLPTDICNAHYNSDFKGSQDALYKALTILAQRHYELNLIIEKNNDDSRTD